MTELELKEALYKPLPDEAIKPHPTKTYLSSIKAIYVTERFNEVFGIGKWSFDVEPVERSENGTVVVKVTFIVPHLAIRYQSFGGNDNGGETNNKNFDLGDAYKGATTDALTKIGSYLGVGIDVFKGLHGAAPKKPQAPDTAPWITDAQVAGAIKKIEAGEEGILDEVFAKYKVSKANRAKLEAAKPKPIDADPKGDDSTQEKPKATRKPRNSAQKEEAAATVKQTPVLDPKAEAIDSTGALKPNDAFVQEMMGERQVKALNWFKAYEGPKWVTVKAYGKLALNGDKDALDKLSKAEDAQSLVTTLSVDDCFKIAAKIKESEVKD